MKNKQDVYTYTDPVTRPCPFDLVISMEAYSKIMGYTRVAQTEITGFADVTLEAEHKRVVVGEVYLLEQEATGAHVQMDEEAVSDFNLQMIKKGVTQLPRLWWHSHVNMEAFFSGTDVATYTETLQNDSWAIALVVNKRRDMKAVFQLYTPFPMTFDMDVFVDYDSVPVPKSIEAEVAKKLKEKKFPAYQLPQGKAWKGKGTWKKKGGILVQEDTEKTEMGIGSDEFTSLLFVAGVQYERVYFLPKDPGLAEEKVTKMGLVRRWSAQRNAFVYCDEILGNIWEDYWNVLQSVPFEGPLKN